MNTVQAFRRSVPHIAIRTIVGGLHRCHATDGEIEQTGDFLRRLNLERLILLHCTGEAAVAKLNEMFSCPVVLGEAGASAWTNSNSKHEGCCSVSKCSVESVAAWDI